MMLKAFSNITRSWITIINDGVRVLCPSSNVYAAEKTRFLAENFNTRSFQISRAFGPPRAIAIFAQSSQKLKAKIANKQTLWQVIKTKLRPC